MLYEFLHELISSHRILLVDDDPFTLNSLTRFFRAYGYKILSAGSAVEGLDLICLNPLIQLVISDFKMPHIDGMEFFREVGKIRPDIRRVLLSAFDICANKLEPMNEGGAHCYISKPWERRALQSVVLEQLYEYHRMEVADGRS